MPSSPTPSRPRFALVPASYVLLLRTRGTGHEVLLQLRQGTGFMDDHWASGIAGHVEAGESALDAAVREAREETGVDLAASDLEPLTAVHRSNEPGGAALEQRVDFFFSARTWAGTPVIREPGKAARLEWFALHALPSPLVPHEELVLARLAAWLDGGAPLPAILTTGFGPRR